MLEETETAPQIAEATGTTIVTDGPSRSEMIQASMQTAVDDLIAAHNKKWAEWNARPDQDDGIEAPSLRDEDILNAKIEGRAKAKAIFHGREPA